MIEFLLVLSVGLSCLLIARRGWIRAIEGNLASVRAAQEDSERLATFADGLIAMAANGATREEIAEEVVCLSLGGTQATSGAFYAVTADGALVRMGVAGNHPLQGSHNQAVEGRASEVAGNFGTETITPSVGLVGKAIEQKRTAALPANVGSGVLAQIAVPVFAGEILIGVLSLAGPTTGGDFDQRAVSNAERFVNNARNWLQRAAQ